MARRSSQSPSSFNYDDPVYRAAREKALAMADGRCPICLRRVSLEVHHRTVPYPSPDKTTADDLLALCRVCHDNGHDVSFLRSAGVSPEFYRAAASELVAILSRPGDDRRRVGRAVRFGGDWGALVSGASRPGVDEVAWLFLRTTRRWRLVAVTEVVDGRPGHWRVRKQFLGASEERRRLPFRSGAASTDRSIAAWPRASGRSGARGPSPRPPRRACALATLRSVQDVKRVDPHS